MLLLRLAEEPQEAAAMQFALARFCPIGKIFKSHYILNVEGYEKNSVIIDHVPWCLPEKIEVACALCLQYRRSFYPAQRNWR